MQSLSLVKGCKSAFIVIFHGFDDDDDDDIRYMFCADCGGGGELCQPKDVLLSRAFQGYHFSSR